MGYPVSKTTAIQPDGKTSAIKCPQTLGTFVTCYKKLSFGPLEDKDGGISGPCGKCALCGNHGSHNSMVPLMKHIRTSNGVRPLTQKLNCVNYYVDQTMTSFSQRWTKYRVLWNKFCYSKIMIIRPYLDIMINIVRKYLPVGLI